METSGNSANWQTVPKRRLSCVSFLKERKNVFYSFGSGSYHSISLRLNRSVSVLDKGMLVMSIDVDVGSKKLGVINEGKNDLNVSSYMSEYAIGAIEEFAVPDLVELLDKYGLPATFAVRGQLAELPDSILVGLVKSGVKHDIGAHGYYHKRFRDLSYKEAETELSLISQGMRRFGLVPKSFVFPRQSIAHLGLLEKYGYECYRDYGDFLNDSMCVRKNGALWDIHPSLAVDRYTKFRFLKTILDTAVRRKLPLHLWFHMRDFGNECSQIKANLEKVFSPFLDYAKRREEENVLTFETMLSAARKARAT